MYYDKLKSIIIHICDISYLHVSIVHYSKFEYELFKLGKKYSHEDYLETYYLD